MTKFNFKSTVCIFVVWAIFFFGVGATVDANGNKYGHIKQRLDAFFTNETETGLMNGVVLVAKKGKIIFEKAYGMANFEEGVALKKRTPFRIASMSKAFAATCIMQLHERGIISIYDTVDKYVPEFSEAYRFTIEQCMNHTAGVYPYLRDWTADTWNYIHLFHTPEQLLRYFIYQPLRFEPGEGYEYSNSNYLLLGIIIERVTGMPYEEYLEKNILKPLKMKDTEYDPGDGLYGNVLPVAYDNINSEPRIISDYLHASVAYSAFGMTSTARDLFLWDQALYTEKIISNESKELMFTPGTENYGFAWWIDSWEINGVPHKQIWHWGGYLGFQSIISRLVDDKVTVIILMNTTPPDFVIPNQLHHLLRGVTDVMFDPIYEQK